jgi:pyruvate,water dikinase
VDRLVASFFQGDYDFFRLAREKSLPDFYTPIGDWQAMEEGDRRLILQDGSSYASGLSSGLAGLMGLIVGIKYLHFLDNIGAYFYFPLAVAKDSYTADAVIRVRVKATAGKIDQAAGLAFALKDVGNYFVLRLNALEDNLILFEFVNNKRLMRAAATAPLGTGRWYTLAVEVSGDTVKGLLDGQALLEYRADHPLHGYVGLWSKADSVSYFADLRIEPKQDKGVKAGD